MVNNRIPQNSTRKRLHRSQARLLAPSEPRKTPEIRPPSGPRRCPARRIIRLKYKISSHPPKSAEFHYPRVPRGTSIFIDTSRRATRKTFYIEDAQVHVVLKRFPSLNGAGVSPGSMPRAPRAAFDARKSAAGKTSGESRAQPKITEGALRPLCMRTHDWPFA